MGDDDELVVRVPLKEYDVMVQAVAALADIRYGNKIVFNKAKFEELLKVSGQVDKMLGKLDEAAEAREVVEAPAKHPVPPGTSRACRGIPEVVAFVTSKIGQKIGNRLPRCPRVT
jgi:hypothetical protein